MPNYDSFPNVTTTVCGKPNNNIVSKTPYTNVTSSDLSTATQGTAIVYGYGDGNWSDKLTSYDGQTISYDASGNLISYKGDIVVIVPFDYETCNNLIQKTIKIDILII